MISLRSNISSYDSEMRDEKKFKIMGGFLILILMSC